MIFNGSYGLLIKPDSATNKKSIEIGEKLTPNAEYKNKNGHVTLFHAKFKGLPTQNIKAALEELSGFKGERFQLNKLQEYGGKFLFWNLKIDKKILQMHKIALSISRFFDQNLAARAIEEELSLSNKEISNIKKYGYPLVNDLYLPHLTISWVSKGVAISAGSQNIEWEMKADDIVFAEIGNYGSMKKVITL